MSGSPDELLRSALEKIVFFECRVASLEGELEAARSALVRAREQAGGSRRRESDLEQEVGRMRAEHALAVGQSSELSERVRLLEAERERFLSGMVERARVAGAPSESGGEAGDPHVLAGFIAELRAEIEELRGWRRAAEAAGVRPGGAVAGASRGPDRTAGVKGVAGPVAPANAPAMLQPDARPLGEREQRDAFASLAGEGNPRGGLRSPWERVQPPRRRQPPPGGRRAAWCSTSGRSRPSRLRP